MTARLQVRHLLAALLLFGWPGPARAQVSVPDAYLPLASDTRIVPVPQEETPLPLGFALDAATAIRLALDTPALRLAAETLQREIYVRYGFRPPLEVGEAWSPGARGISIGTLEQGGEALQAVAVRRAEGYVLRVEPAGIDIVGADERGAFYGIQSLRQLLADEPVVRGVLVRDWPELPLRVAMVYLDVNSDAVNLRLLPILAAHKFNGLLVMSDYIHWDSAPELRLATGAPKEAVRRLVEAARAQLLEPIPLLETLGHSQWLFQNGSNRDLLQDPTVSVPFAYDPLNPRVYEVLFPILDELLELFAPAWVHIGHDEVRNVIPFPATEGGRRLGFPRLFLDDTRRLHGYLAERGVGTMMWHDVLLAEDVRPVLEQFPDDILVAAWRYLPAGAYPHLKQLQQAGFEVLGASWSNPDNITAYARDAARQGARGMIQTRWTGYFGNSGILNGQYGQVYAYLTAAAAFWNPDAPPLEDAPARFRRAWLAEGAGSARAGTLIELRPFANQDLAGTWLGLAPDYNLSALLEPGLRLGGVRFDLGGAVALRGSHRRARTLPERVEIPLGVTAATLVFLHASGWSAPAFGDEIGRYTLHYADGSRATLPLQYGVNIATWTETEVSSMTLEQPWRGRTPNGLEVAVNLLRWDNPRPELIIERLELESAGGLANPILLGLTLLE